MVQTPINQQENVTIWSVSLCVSKAAVLQPQKLQIFFLALIPQFFPNLLWSDRFVLVPLFQGSQKSPPEKPKKSKKHGHIGCFGALISRGGFQKVPQKSKKGETGSCKSGKPSGIFCLLGWSTFGYRSRAQHFDAKFYFYFYFYLIIIKKISLRCTFYLLSTP